MTRPCPSLQACKFALRMCGPSMGCPMLCDMFQNHLHEDRSLHYGEFMNDVCKHLVRERQPLGSIACWEQNNMGPGALHYGAITLPAHLLPPRDVQGERIRLSLDSAKFRPKKFG